MGAFCRVDRLGPVTRFRMARTVLGRPLYVTACYRVGEVLLDAGCPRARRAFLARPEARGIAEALVTHHHEDHAGLCAELRDRGARVRAPQLAVAPIRDGYGMEFYRRVVWGVPRRAEVEPLREARVEAGGRRWLVVPTPGHSPDHVAFVDEAEHWCFAGDAYFGKLRFARRDEDMRGVLDSLRRLRDREPSRLFPAHRDVEENPRRALDAAIEHLERLSAEARRLLEAGLTLRKVRRRLLGRASRVERLSLGHFSAENLLRGLLASRP